MLLLEDDSEISETVAAALGSTRLTVLAVFNGEQALAAASDVPFDLLLVDLRLPDLPGLEVVRRLRAQNIRIPFIVVSGFARADVVADARKLGALAILEKPVAMTGLLDAVNAVLWPASDGDAPGPAARRTLESKARGTSRDRLVSASEPRSTVERWATFVLRAVDADGDPKTLDYWARSVGVSRSVLCECCRLVHISPHDARDFARVLRAVYRRSGEKWQPELDIDVADIRTLKRLEKRAGLSNGDGAVPTVEAFLESQDLIPRDNSALLAIRRMLKLSEEDSGR